MTNNTDYHQFIDNDEGWVDRRIFWEEEIYEQELKQIFAKSWQFIAHDSMIPNANDFYTTYMGEDGVIGARQTKAMLALLYVITMAGVLVLTAS